jgi:hypothetical protein
MYTPEPEMTVEQALPEFHDLLRTCAMDASPPRALPVRYQICRTALMTAGLRAHLPGFVRQCVSSLAFREFIHHYHHDPALRLQFIDASMADAWSQISRTPALPSETASSFDDFMFDPPGGNRSPES